MNAGIKTMIERMQTNPEEFSNNSRWRILVADFRADLDPEDLEAFDNAYRKCRQEEFTSIVVQRLLTEEREDKEALKKHRRGNNLMAINQITTEALKILEDELHLDEDGKEFEYKWMPVKQK